MKSKKIFVDAKGLYFVHNFRKWYVGGITETRFRVDVFRDGIAIEFKGVLENQN